MDPHMYGEEKKGGKLWRRLGFTLGGTVLFASVAYLALPLWVDRIGGASSWSVLEGSELGSKAQHVVKQSLQGMRGKTLLDVHVHLAGRGLGSDCWVNPQMQSRLHPSQWVRFQTYLSAGRVGGSDPDQVFATGVADLIGAMPLPVRAHLLAFDYARDGAGEPDLAGSSFMVPDGYAQEQAARAGPGFVPAFSIHPRDPQALERLEAASKAGVRLIKWLPAAQNIDPADGSFETFYRTVRDLDLTLLVHCGSEHAVKAGHAEGYGNPLRLRVPLEVGVRVLVAHCATGGMGADLDKPENPDQPNFQLFLRLMDEPRYEGLLFGDISTVAQVNRFEHGLEELLERTELHSRFVYGSDWPLPAIHVLYRLGPLVDAGFLSEDAEGALEQIYDHNPMLFSFVLARQLHHPKDGTRFSTKVFTWSKRGPW